LRFLASRVDDGPATDLLLPAGDGQPLAWLYRHGRVTSRHQDEGGAIRVSVKLDDRSLGQFEHLFPGIAPVVVIPAAAE
jgi:GTP-binding protein HflX